MEKSIEEYFTQKKCKCGSVITIFYHYGGTLDMDIRIADQFDGYESNGHFRSGNQWPNWVYCRNCSRKHDLTKFKGISKETP